jgi:hypothetical protein
MTLAAPSIQPPGPLMQFSARVGSSRACVRIQSSRLEWSLIGRQWIIQMAPMTSITAVQVEPLRVRSRLILKTTVGMADFRVDSETADKARDLLMRLIKNSSATADASADDELINLKWKLDPHVVDPSDFEEAPRRLLGF